MIKTSDYAGYQSTARLNKFTFAIRLKYEKSDRHEIKTMIGHSNCGCYDFNIEPLNNEIIFEKRCTGP